MKKSIFLLLLIASQFAWGQNDAKYLQYIEKYAPIAVEQMQLHNIPASITLAQGLLESAAGSSYLARNANNHFGIKMGSDWTGPTLLKPDDHADDRFRVYDSVRDSYEDHSRFLQRKRYESLFSLSPIDYRGWATGLKRCGYATDPAYAQKLIGIIDNYQLYNYDHSVLRPAAAATGVCNGIPFVTVMEDDCLASIASRTGVSIKKLVKYNELSSHYVLTVGDRIYLKKKARRAAKEYKDYMHSIAAGESMHSISQKYGIRMSRLYKMNKLDNTYIPRIGDRLKVR